MVAGTPFILTIDKIEPDVLVENRRTHIFFSLCNLSGQDDMGVVNALLFVGGTQFSPIHSTAWSVQIPSEQTASGVVTIVPPAGKHLPLALIYQGSENRVMEETWIDVAARYSLGLLSFKADQIRGGFHDEVFVTVALDTGNPLTSVQRQVHIGKNIIRGDQVNFPPECMVYPLDVVPGVARENVVALSFVMINKDTGGTFDLLKSIADELSDLGQAVASAFVPGDTMALVNQRVHSLHSALFGGCDGVLAADRVVLSGAQLAKWTESVDQFAIANFYKGASTGSALAGCNQTPSVYEVTWALNRQRLDPNAIQVVPEYKTLSPGEVFEFHEAHYLDFHPPNVRWSIDAGEGDQGGIDPSFGTYKAPADSDSRSLHIVRATADDGRYSLGFVRVLPKGPMVTLPKI